MAASNDESSSYEDPETPYSHAFNPVTLTFHDPKTEDAFRTTQFRATHDGTQLFLIVVYPIVLCTIALTDTDKEPDWASMCTFTIFCIAYSLPRYGLHSMSDKRRAHQIFCMVDLMTCIMCSAVVVAIVPSGTIAPVSFGGLAFRAFCYIFGEVLPYVYCLPFSYRLLRSLGGFAVIRNMPLEKEIDIPMARNVLLISQFIGHVCGHCIMRYARVSYYVHCVAARKERRFLAHVFHEVRNPLNGIAGHLRLAAEHCRKEGGNAAAAGEVYDGGVVSEHIESATRCVDHALLFLNQLTHFEKLEAQAWQSNDPSPVAIPALLSRAMSIAQPSVQPSVQLRLSVGKGLGEGRRVVIDTLLMTEIIVNLVQNAARFTSSGFIEVFCDELPVSEHAAAVSEEAAAGKAAAGDPDVAEGVAAASLRVMIGVRDTGCGISPSVLPTLCDRYTHSIGGVGLGLHLTQKQLELMGSSLRVTSPWRNSEQHGLNGSGGAEFRFALTLPAAESAELVEAAAEETLVPAAEATASATARLPKQLRVLVCDDMKMNRVLLSAILSKVCSTWHIATAESAELAIALTNDASAEKGEEHSGGYDLLIIDEHFDSPIHDPTARPMQGTHAIRIIRQREAARAAANATIADTPACLVPSSTMAIISCSGNAQVERLQLLAAGADLAWDKPFPDHRDGSMQEDLLRVLAARKQ